MSRGFAATGSEAGPRDLIDRWTST